MDKSQFERMVKGKGTRGPRPLFTDGVLATFLGNAARAAERVRDAREAWERVAEPDWLERTRVVGLEDGVLEIAVPDSTLRYELTRKASTLTRKLAGVAYGVKSVRFTPRG